MACCLFVWLVVVGFFFFLGHWVYDRLSILVGWVIIIKAWTMQMEFGTVHMVSVLLLSEGRPSQRCWWAQVFPTKKKTQFFWTKKIGVEYGKGKLQPHSDMWAHEGQGRVESSRVEVREGASVGTHIMDSLRF